MQTAIIPGTTVKYLTQPMTESEAAAMLENELELYGTVRIPQKLFETSNTEKLGTILSRLLIGSEKLQEVSYRIITKHTDYIYLEIHGELDVKDNFIDVIDLNNSSYDEIEQILIRHGVYCRPGWEDRLKTIANGYDILRIEGMDPNCIITTE